MHKATRVHKEWIPVAVMRAGGSLSEGQSDVLAEEVRKMAELWRESPELPKMWVPDRSHLEKPAVHVLREVSFSFPAGTVASLDQVHPRHFGMLGDEGLEVIAELIIAIEALGMFPDQIWFLLLPLLAKPKGGYRTILVQAGLVRLWERLRRRELNGFFDEVDRDYWAFGAGTSAEDTVWLNTAEA
jgi:hypothetical protein